MWLQGTDGDHHLLEREYRLGREVGADRLSADRPRETLVEQTRTNVLPAVTASSLAASMATDHNLLERECRRRIRAGANHLPAVVLRAIHTAVDTSPSLIGWTDDDLVVELMHHAMETGQSAF